MSALQERCISIQRVFHPQWVVTAQQITVSLKKMLSIVPFFPQSPKQITQQNPELTLQRCYRDCFFLFHSDTSIFNIILSKKILWRTLKASDVLGRPKTNFYGILLLIWCSVEIRDKITRSWKGKTLGLNCYSIEVAAGG